MFQEFGLDWFLFSPRVSVFWSEIWTPWHSTRLLWKTIYLHNYNVKIRMTPHFPGRQNRMATVAAEQNGKTFLEWFSRNTPTSSVMGMAVKFSCWLSRSTPKTREHFSVHLARHIVLQAVWLSPTVPSVLDTKTCAYSYILYTAWVLSALTGMGLAAGWHKVETIYINCFEALNLIHPLYFS